MFRVRKRHWGHSEQLEGRMRVERSGCGSCDKLEPLPESVAKDLRQGVDVSQDDVEWERKLPHVRSEFWHLKMTSH